MKFNIKYFSISLIPALMVLSSCTKKLDLNPTYTINGDASFTTIADYEASLVGTYARLKANSYYGTIHHVGLIFIVVYLFNKLHAATFLQTCLLQGNDLYK